MPNINTYRSRSTIQNPGGIAQPDMSGAARGAQTLGDSLMRLGADQKEREQDKYRADLALAVNKYQLRMVDESSKIDVPAYGTGYTEKVQELSQKIIGEVSADLPTAYADKTRVRFDEAQTGFVAAAIKRQAAMRGEYERDAYQRLIHQNANQIASSPEFLDQALRTNTDFSEAYPSLSDEQRQSIRREGAQTYISAYISGAALGNVDPRGALDRVESGEFDSYLDPNQKVAAVQRLRSAIAHGQQVNTGRINSAFNATLELYRDGAAVSSQQAERVLADKLAITEDPQEQVDAQVDLLVAGAQGGYKRVFGDSIQAANSYLADARQKLADVAGDDPLRQNAVRKGINALESYANAMTDKFISDPVGWMLEESPAVAKQYGEIAQYVADQEYGKAQVQRQQMSETMIAMQAERGLTGIAASVLTKAEARQLQSEMLDPSITAGDKYQKLTALQAMHGDYFGNALADIFGRDEGRPDPDVQAYGYAATIPDPGLAINALGALTNRKDSITAIGKDNADLIKNTVLNETTEYLQAFPGAQAAALVGLRDTASALAYQAVVRGVDPTTAATTAVERVVSASYKSIDGGIRIPRTNKGEPVPADAVDVGTFNTVLQSAPDKIIEIIGDKRFSSDEERRRLKNADISLVTSGDESGVYITIALQNGDAEVIADKNGNAAIIDWQTLVNYDDVTRGAPNARSTIWRYTFGAGHTITTEVESGTSYRVSKFMEVYK